VAGEKERGLTPMILSKPMPRWAFLLSKFAAQTLLYLLGFTLFARFELRPKTNIIQDNHAALAAVKDKANFNQLAGIKLGVGRLEIDRREVIALEDNLSRLGLGLILPPARLKISESVRDVSEQTLFRDGCLFVVGGGIWFVLQTGC
jgi:hypothetical protein